MMLFVRAMQKSLIWSSILSIVSALQVPQEGSNLSNTSAISNAPLQRGGEDFDSIVSARLPQLQKLYPDIALLTVTGTTHLAGSYSASTYKGIHLSFYTPLEQVVYTTSNVGGRSPAEWSVPQRVEVPSLPVLWQWSQRRFPLNTALAELQIHSIYAPWTSVALSRQHVPGTLPADLYYSWVAPEWRPPKAIYVATSTKQITYISLPLHEQIQDSTIGLDVGDIDGVSVS